MLQYQAVQIIYNFIAVFVSFGCLDRWKTEVIIPAILSLTVELNLQIFFLLKIRNKCPIKAADAPFNRIATSSFISLP